MTLDERYDWMIEMIGCTEDELGVAIHFGGYNEDTINELFYYKTGYRSIEEYEECELEDED